MDYEAELAAARADLRRRGWTDADLAAFERKRLPIDPGTNPQERARLRLHLYKVLPPLPEVALPDEVLAARGVDTGMLAKVRALLAKAESTTFPEEAESLSAKAQELMTRHRIDSALLGGPGGGAGGRRIWVDDPYAAPKVSLLSAVARANGCRAVELGNLGCVHVVGFPADLEVVELLHTSLLVQAASAMLGAGPQVDARGRSRTRSFRRSFLLAYAWRIGTRLAEASAATEAAADAERGGDLLPVLRKRDAEVEDAVAEAFPNLRDRRISRVTNAAGWGAGVAAADRADLARDARIGGGPTGALGRGS
ncbi:MAG: hypothetical protein JWN67_291 [Actinomycetia bacterium]|nr:hypothetical protein [Actinomycetes bacterium]